MGVNWSVLILCIIICNLVGAIGALWAGGDSDWYKNLKKPGFNPPSWLFGPVWTLLFTLMGISLYFVYSAPSSEVRLVALVLFGIQFLFNVLWSYLFFGLNSPLIAFIEIIILLIFIVFTIIWFFKINSFSGYLMIPYFVWVLFASILNGSIWRLNL